MAKKDELKPSDLYLTPPSIARCVEYFFHGPADYDPYGDPQQLVPARKIRSWDTRDEEFDARCRTVWANPPFSKTRLILPELSRRSYAQRFDCVALVPASTTSQYWVDHVWTRHHVPIIGLMKRFSYLAPGPNGPQETEHNIRTETALIYFCPDISHPRGNKQRAHDKINLFKKAFHNVCRAMIRPTLA